MLGSTAGPLAGILTGVLGEGGCTSMAGGCCGDGCGGACWTREAFRIAPVYLGTPPDSRGCLGIAPVGRGIPPVLGGVELAAAATAAPTAAATACSTVVEAAGCGVVLRGGEGSCTKLVSCISGSGSGSGALIPNRC